MNSDNPQFGNTYAGYAEAMAILTKYCDKPYGVEGHHDEVLAGPGLPSQVSEADKARLTELGWRIDLGMDCFAKAT